MRLQVAFYLSSNLKNSIDFSKILQKRMMLHPGHHVLAMMQGLLNSYISTLYSPDIVKQLADDLFACCKDLNDVLDSYPTLLTQWITCGTKIKPDIAQSTDTTECIQSNVHKLSLWILDMRMNLLMSFTSKLFKSDHYEKIYNVLTFTNRLKYDEQMTNQFEHAMTEYRAAYHIQATEQPVMGEHPVFKVVESCVNGII